MSKRMNFIKVADKDIAAKLEKIGFNLIEKTEDSYLFLNNDKLLFSDDIDMSKVCYTNILCI